MDTSHLDLFDPDSYLPQTLAAKVKRGDLSSIQESYTSSADASLLTRIAEQATRYAQPDILAWAFTQGLVVSLPFTPTTVILDNRIYCFACIARSLPIWKMLVAHGMPIAAHHDESVGDMLSVSVFHQDMEILQFALDNGCKPDEAFGYDSVGIGATAVKNDSVDILRLLVKHGWTPASFDGAHIAAAELGRMDCLRFLVEEGKANLEETCMWWSGGDEDEIGTALYRAALKGREDAVEYLLGRGANVQFNDSLGRGVAWAARRGVNNKVVEMVQDVAI